jgi:hypothetical protein
MNSVFMEVNSYITTFCRGLCLPQSSHFGQHACVTCGKDLGFLCCGLMKKHLYGIWNQDVCRHHTSLAAVRHVYELMGGHF